MVHYLNRRSIKEKYRSGIIDLGVKRISEFGNDHFIPHFIICSGNWFNSYAEQTFEETILSKMRRYVIKSAILSILGFRRADLKTKEAVKQQHRSMQLEKDQGKNVTVQRIISEDLELFYTSLQNPERQPKEEYVDIFSTKKLTEEELTLLENRNRGYLNTFSDYGPDGVSFYFDSDMKEIEKSNDPESIFSRSYGNRWTIPLYVTVE